MPAFLKDLRRRSRASFLADTSSHGNTNGSPVRENSGFLASSGFFRSKSSSTLSTANGSASTNGTGATTPPETLAHDDALSEIKSTASTPRRVPARSASKRYSIVGANGSPPSMPRTFTPTSLYAPHVHSVTDGSWVHQKVLLIHGQIGEPTVSKPLDGNLTVFHHIDNFPPVSWPVSESHFKALVHLQPGPNRLRLEFTSSRRASNDSGSTSHINFININYLPLNNAPPLHLAILLAKDSEGTFDAVPERIQREGNNLDTALRKFKMAAYLWQAFTGEQMNRNSFGRRCWRYEEEWQQGTLTFHDVETGTMRNEAKIHVIRLDKTLAEIRDLELAQQYSKATRKGELFDIAMDACKKYFVPKEGQTQYVSCMFLDSKWDTTAQTIRGHAALGGGDNSLKLAIFGSHALQSYPSCLEEVVPAFSDCTRTDTKYVANDCSESGSNWEAANIGIGAHLHETGHLFGCPHQDSGVMLRDYVRLNRTFVCREPYSTRTKNQGVPLCLPKDECTWHRLDCLRFRYHPCFRLPTDPLLPPDGGVQVWSVDNNAVLATSKTGVAFAEIYVEGHETPKAWIEYVDPMGQREPTTCVQLVESELRSRLPDNLRNIKKLTIKLFSMGGGETVVDDFSKLTSKANAIKLPNGRNGYRANRLGFSQMNGSEPQRLFIDSAFNQKKLMVAIKVYHGLAVDGIEFIYEDSTSQLFGKRGGSPGGTEFPLDTRRSEVLLGFYLRAGFWIDGIQILTSLGRKSEIFGNATGGSGHTLIPPRGYTIGGIEGSSGDWLDGFGLIITR